MNLGLISLCGAALMASIAASGGEFDLKSYQNRNRLVFVFAPDKTSPLYRRQAALWNGKRAGMNERDIIRFNVFERRLGKTGGALPADAADLRKQFKIRRGVFRMVLVGKDGHTAFSSARPVSAARLFALIDAMPMRRQEMKERH